MDAPEADFDIKLQKVSGDLIADFDRFLPTFIRRPDGNGGLRVRSRVRAREVEWATATCLDPFQELPQLLDHHLPKWIPFLSEAYLERTQARHRDREQQQQQRQDRSDSAKHLVSVEYAICKILYTFCKIRGEKIIVHFLNVEARYLELLLGAIEDAEQAVGVAAWSWEQRYIVLLWISHLLLAPFDLSTISSVDLDQITVPPAPGLTLPSDLPGITLRAIPLAIKYLASPGKERDGAKALLVRMAMRKDMQQSGVLDSLVQWSLAALRPLPDATPEGPYYYLGILSFLAGILRSSSDTSDLNAFLHPIFTTVHAISTAEDDVFKSITSFALARKMMIKVIRSAVVSLLNNEDDMENTEITETAIQYLLECLADNDTPVRFAASKSLSIITLRLDPDMASQVVEAVLESLNRNVLWKKPDGQRPIRDLAAVDPLEWHGLMLTLSHLLYRRSPPADQLSDITHALLLGLSFEKRSVSGSSVGSNVRDAACFGIWALSRRYTTEELLAVPTHSVFAAKAHPASSSILQVLGTELVTTASLDPAGNIRRGASAALQELIGRHPDTVEKGIWVVQTVDYHSVARRSRAMNEVALGSAKLSSQYGEALIDGILGWRGVGDVESVPRRDAATAFGALITELASSTSGSALKRFELSIDLVIEKLSLLERRQVEDRHGLLLCLAAVVEQFPMLLQHSSEINDDSGVSKGRLVTHIVSEVAAILEDCKTTTYRRPEFVAESASKLVISLLPVLQESVLGQERSGELLTMSQLLTLPDTQSQGYLPIVSSIDSKEKGSVMKNFLSALRDVVPQWLSRNETETMVPASGAALVLLLFSTPADRMSTLNNWAASVEAKPTSRKTAIGDGYFYTLAMAEPLVDAFDSTGAEGDIVCKAISNRWSVDPEVDTRVAMLQALTQSRILRDKPLAFLGMLFDGLNDYTTNARGDVGSHVRVQALRAVKSLWKDAHTASANMPWLETSVKALFYSTLRLSAEKLDRIRPEAQAAVALMLQGESADRFRSTTFSSKSYFRALLGLAQGDDTPHHPAVSALAESDVGKWMAELLSGYVTSADTGNEDLVIASRAALTDFCNESPENMRLVYAALLENLKTRQGQDRVTVPTLEVIAFLFRVGVMQRSEDLNLRSLCLQTQKAGYKTGNMRKIEACIKVYGGVAALGGNTDGPGIKEARKRLGALLFHPWPKVRISVVDELWVLVSDQLHGREHPGDQLAGVDWGTAGKDQIRSVVQALRLE